MRLSELDKNIIFQLMMQRKSISVGRLAELCDASENTIRYRIPILNEQIYPFNLHITVKHSSGCALEKIDKNESASQDDLRYDIKRNLYFEDNYSRDFIIRSVISSSEYMPIDTLCENLGYSYSELHRCIKDVDAFLDEFHLKMVTRRGKGLTIEGSEFNKRLCIIFEHKPFIKLAEEEQKKEKRFGNMFITHGGPQHIRNELAKTLAAHPKYRFSFLDFPKIFNMAILIHTRHRYADQLVFSNDITEKLLSSESYQIASEFMERLGKETSFVPDRNELVSLAAVISCYRSATNFQDLPPHNQKELYSEADRLLDYAFGTAFAGEDPTWKNRFSEHLACLLYTIKTMVHYDVPIDKEVFFPLQETGTLSVDLSIDMYHYLREEMNITIPGNLLLYTNYFARGMIREITNRHPNTNVLLLTLYGSEYAIDVKDKLMSLYKRNIRNVDILDSTYLQAVSSDYDLLLTDVPQSMIPEDVLDTVPVVYLPFINSSAPIVTLEEYFNKNRLLFLNSISQGRTLHTSCKNENEIYETIYDLLHDSVRMTKEEMKKEITRRNSIYSPVRSNHTAFLAFDRYSPDEDALIVLINKKAIPFHGQKIQFFIFYNLTRQRIRNFININSFLRRFVRRTPTELRNLLNVKPEMIINTIMEYPDINIR